MPTHSRPQFLRRAIASVLGQSMPDLEVLVINDAGDDPTAITNAFGDPRVRLLQHEHNRGLAAARNTGLRAARGDFIAYCDDDDYFHPEHCAHLLTQMQQSGAAMLYSDAWATEEAWANGVATVRKRSLVYSRAFDLGALLCDNLLPVTTVMHRRALLAATDGFDETLRVHEDWEHWIRVAGTGAAVAHDATITCEYTTRPGTGNMRTQWNARFLETFQVIHLRYREPSERAGVVAQQATVRTRCAVWSKQQLALLTDDEIAAAVRSGLLLRLTHGVERLGPTATDRPAVHALVLAAAGRARIEPESWVAIGAVARMNGKLNEALAALGEAARLGDPSSLHGELALLCTALGHPHDAKHHAEIYRRRTGLTPAAIAPAPSRVGMQHGLRRVA